MSFTIRKSDRERPSLEAHSNRRAPFSSFVSNPCEQNCPFPGTKPRAGSVSSVLHMPGFFTVPRQDVEEPERHQIAPWQLGMATPF